MVQLDQIHSFIALVAYVGYKQGVDKVIIFETLFSIANSGDSELIIDGDNSPFDDWCDELDAIYQKSLRNIRISLWSYLEEMNRGDHSDDESEYICGHDEYLSITE